VTLEQIQLVQASLAKIAPIAGPAAALFYQRLFTLDPTAPQRPTDRNSATMSAAPGVSLGIGSRAAASG